MSMRSPGMYLAYIVQALIAFNVLLAVLFKPQDVLIGVILFLIALVIYLFSWKTKIIFPWFVYFLVSLAVLIHTSGYIQGRYLTFVNWDMLAHTVSGTDRCPDRLPGHLILGQDQEIITLMPGSSGSLSSPSDVSLNISGRSGSFSSIPSLEVPLPD